MVLPIGFSAPPVRRRPYATAVLVALLAAVFIRLLLLRDAPPALFCSDLTESARALSRSADTVQGFLCRWGAVPDDLAERRGLHTLVTSVLVHAGWWHLLGNVAFLVAFAPRVEEDLGVLGFAGVFLGSAVIAGTVHVLLVPDLTAPSVGASGGVAGVLGAHLLLARGAQVRVLVGVVPMRLPTRFVILVWAALQAVYTAVLLNRAVYPGGVSYEVHAVGFVVGLLLVAAALRVRPQLRQWPPAAQRASTSAAPVSTGTSKRLPYSAQPPS